MIQKFLLSLFVIISVGSILFFSLAPTYAADPEASQSITDKMKNSIKGVDLPNGGNDPEARAVEIAGSIISAILSLFGVIFMGLMVYGGFIWMTAAGHDDKIDKAKEIIKAAIIGLIVVMLSFVISLFVVNALQSAAAAS